MLPNETITGRAQKATRVYREDFRLTECNMSRQDMSFYLTFVSTLPNETVTGPSTSGSKSSKGVQRGFRLTRCNMKQDEYSHFI